MDNQKTGKVASAHNSSAANGYIKKLFEDLLAEWEGRRVEYITFRSSEEIDDKQLAKAEEVNQCYEELEELINKIDNKIQGSITMV